MTGLGIEGERAWEQLSQHLEWAEGTWLVYVFTQSTVAARELERRTHSQLELRGDRDRVLRPRTPQQLRELLPLLMEGPTAAVTWVEAVHLDPGSNSDPGPWVEAWDWFLLRANERREALMKAVGGGLILAAPVTLKHRFREAAPDLWSVRSLVLDADLPMVEPLATLPYETTQEVEVDALLAQGWVSEAAPLADDVLEVALGEAEQRPMDRKAMARLAEAWERRGRILRDQGELVEAATALDEAETLRRDLAEGPPSRRRAQRAELAATRCLRAQVELDRGDLEHARSLGRASVHESRALSRDNDDPETLAELALALSVLGDIELASDDEDEALRCYLDALVLRQHVVGATNAARHRRWLSVAWGRVGRVRMRLGDRVGARSAWQRAWELMQELAARDPGNVTWQMEASVAGCRWGDAAFADMQLEMAEHAWRTALDIREQLASQDPDNARWQQYLAVALGRMARLHAARADRDTAVQLAARAVRISQQLVDEHPGHSLWVAGLERAQRRLEEIRRL